MAKPLSWQIFSNPIEGLKTAREYLSHFYRKPSEMTAQELIERDIFYGLIIENSRDALLLVNSEGTVEFINPAAEKLFCQSAKEIIGQRFEYPLDENLRQEVCVSRPGEKTIIVDMHVNQVTQDGRTFYLAQFRDITELVELREELRILSLTDELTGLYNRRAFTLLAKQQVKLATRNQQGMYFFFIDIDGMKTINDSLGHNTGDLVLVEFAKILTQSFRSSDLIVRMGGDEFMVLAVDSHPESRFVLEKRLQESLDAFNRRRSRGFQISFSMGTVRYDPKRPISIEELVEQADQLMYQEKCAKSGVAPEPPPQKPLINSLLDFFSIENLVPVMRPVKDKVRQQGVTFTLLKDIEEALQFGLGKIVPQRKAVLGLREKV